MWVIAAASFSVVSAASAAQVIDRQSQSGVAFGDPAEFRQRIGRQHGDRDAGLFRFRPEPVDRAVVQPLPRRIVQERIAQAEHARLLAPGRDARAGRWLVERQRAHDREPARVVLHRRECHVGRSSGPNPADG